MMIFIKSKGVGEPALRRILKSGGGGGNGGKGGGSGGGRAKYQ